MESYAQNMQQISLYNGGMTYGDLFAGQTLNLWRIDEVIPTTEIIVLSISDFNRAMAMQGKKNIVLAENEYLLNCNYEGTRSYVQRELQQNQTLLIGGISLQSASSELLNETYVMTSVGNNDRGTLIVPDVAAMNLAKDLNVLLVQYQAGASSDALLQKNDPDRAGRYAGVSLCREKYDV